MVAISLFTVQNLMGSLPSSTFTKFEFVDILCSMGACSLIFIGVILYGSRRKMESVWMSYHDQSPHFHRQATKDVKSVHGISQGYLDFYVMSAHFRVEHNVGHDFDFYEYMRETLSEQICYLINIGWYTWVALLVLSLVCLGWIEAYQEREEPVSALSKVTIFAVVSWICVCGKLLVYLKLRRKFAHLQQKLGTQDRDVVEECLQMCINDLEKSGLELDGKRSIIGSIKTDTAGLSTRYQFDRRLAGLLRSHGLKAPTIHVRTLHVAAPAIQLLALLSCFQLALYVMTVGYNIHYAHLHWIWHLAIVCRCFSASWCCCRSCSRS
jgi:hypothetical protein